MLLCIFVGTIFLQFKIFKNGVAGFSMFQTNKSVILIGGGPISNIPDYLEELPVIAVDGGLDTCLHHSIKPDYFIGDMDSASKSAKEYAVSCRIPTNPIFEQETNDFEKALMHVDALGYICFGFLGGRMDHTFATLHVVQKLLHKRPVLLYGSEDIILAASATTTLTLPVGERISVWPLGVVHFKSSVGLRYPLNDIEMTAGSQIGTSNLVSKETVRLIVSEKNKGTYLIILPNRYFKDLFMLTDTSSVPK